MFVLTEVLQTAFLKESAFAKHLLIYFLQQTKMFNSGLNARQKLKTLRILSTCPALTLNALFVSSSINEHYQFSYKSFCFKGRVYNASGLPLSVSSFFTRSSHPNKGSYQKLAYAPLQHNYHWLPDPNCMLVDGYLFKVLITYVEIR